MRNLNSVILMYRMFAHNRLRVLPRRVVTLFRNIEMNNSRHSVRPIECLVMIVYPSGTTYRTLLLYRVLNILMKVILVPPSGGEQWNPQHSLARKVVWP